jgi:hypothetical protein
MLYNIVTTTPLILILCLLLRLRHEAKKSQRAFGNLTASIRATIADLDDYDKQAQHCGTPDIRDAGRHACDWESDYVAVPPVEDLWGAAGPERSVGTRSNLMTARATVNKLTIQEQINQALSERISALETYRKQHAHRLNEIEDTLGETGTDAHAYAVATGHADAGEFEIRDLTEAEIDLLAETRRLESAEGLVPGTLVVTHSAKDLAQIYSDKDGHAEDLTEAEIEFNRKEDARVEQVLRSPFFRSMTSHELADHVLGRFDPDITQPMQIRRPVDAVDHFLPRQWSDGDQTVVDAQSVVRDGWSN